MNEAAISHILSLTADPYPEPDYRVCRVQADMDAYFRGTTAQYLACDTESLPDGSPYCVTFSHTPGTGRLVYAANREMLESLVGEITVFGLAMEEEYVHLLFHNYLHDVEQFERLDIPVGPFTDTMVRAYNLCLGGGGDDESESRAGRGALGLKVLARRFCNMRMTSFRETVYPHSIPKMLKWLELVEDVFQYSEPPSSCEHCGHLTEDHALSAKGSRGKCLVIGNAPCSCKRHKKHAPKKTEEQKKHGLLNRKTNNLIKALTDKVTPDQWEPADDEEDSNDTYNLVDPWKRVRNWHKHDHVFLDEVGLLPYPRASVADVPEKELLAYGCRDSDATLRLFLFLQTHTPWIFY